MRFERKRHELSVYVDHLTCSVMLGNFLNYPESHFSNLQTEKYAISEMFHQDSINKHACVLNLKMLHRLSQPPYWMQSERSTW